MYDGISLISWLFSRLVDTDNSFSRVVATGTLTLSTRGYCTRHNKVMLDAVYVCDHYETMFCIWT